MDNHRRIGWYSFTVRVQTRAADVDHQGHVNNIAMTGLHAEARNLWHRALLLITDPQDLVRMLGRIHTRHYACRYQASTYYPSPLTFGVRLLDVNGEVYRLATASFQDGRCTSDMVCTLGCGDGDHWNVLPDSLHGRLIQYRDSYAT